MEGEAIACVAYVVPVALHAVPTNVTANGRAEGQRWYGNGAAACDAQELHASAGRAMQNGYRTQGAGNNDAISRESVLQLTLCNLGAPLGAAVAQAVLIGVLDQKGRTRLIVSENKVPVFGRASAVGVIIGGRRFAVIPEDFARGRVGDAAQMGINACYCLLYTSPSP